MPSLLSSLPPFNTGHWAFSLNQLLSQVLGQKHPTSQSYLAGGGGQLREMNVGVIFLSPYFSKAAREEGAPGCRGLEQLFVTTRPATRSTVKGYHWGGLYLVISPP